MKFNRSRTKKLAKIFAFFGMIPQLLKLKEECEELADAIKEYRERMTSKNGEHLIEELADVLIMSEQIVLGLTKEQNQKLQETIDFKISRTIARIEAEDE